MTRQRPFSADEMSTISDFISLVESSAMKYVEGGEGAAMEMSTMLRAMQAAVQLDLTLAGLKTMYDITDDDIDRA